MNIEHILIAALLPDPANVRLHAQRNLDVIAASLKRFGQQKPIVVDSNGIVRAGNGTLAAARALGWTHIDIVRTDLHGPEATAYAIADNRAAELATWDTDILATALADAGIGDVGFTGPELQQLLGETPFIPEAEPAESIEIGESFQVIVECEDEADQKSIYNRLHREGYPCRLLTL